VKEISKKGSKRPPVKCIMILPKTKTQNWKGVSSEYEYRQKIDKTQEKNQ
jgi:hypothetical protein